jgi:hypothetical protein
MGSLKLVQSWATTSSDSARFALAAVVPLAKDRADLWRGRSPDRERDERVRVERGHASGLSDPLIVVRSATSTSRLQRTCSSKKLSMRSQPSRAAASS